MRFTCILVLHNGVTFITEVAVTINYNKTKKSSFVSCKIVLINFSPGKTEKGDSAPGSDIKKGKPGQSPRPPTRYVNLQFH